MASKSDGWPYMVTDRTARVCGLRAASSCVGSSGQVVGQLSTEIQPLRTASSTYCRSSSPIVGSQTGMGSAAADIDQPLVDGARDIRALFGLEDLGGLEHAHAVAPAHDHGGGAASELMGRHQAV